MLVADQNRWIFQPQGNQIKLIEIDCLCLEIDKNYRESY